MAKLSSSTRETARVARFRRCRSCGKRDEAGAGDAQTEIQLGDPVAPAVARMSIRLQQQIRDLEQNLEEERRALMEAERRYAELKEKYEAVIQRVGT